jgi:hypothetical protein
MSVQKSIGEKKQQAPEIRMPAAFYDYYFA